MKRTVDIEVPLGYRIVDKTENTNVWDAERILTSRKQRYYTKAIRNGIDVEMTGSYLACPFCGMEFAFNTRYSACGYRRYPKSERIHKDAIYNWSSLQLSIFEETADNVLHISSPLNKPSSFKCPECNNISNYSDGVKPVKLIFDREMIMVRSEVSDINEFFGLKWIAENSVPITFPMYEILTFNFKKGRIYIKLENNLGHTLSQRDVTAYPEVICGSIAHSLIMYNKKVNRNIKRLFKEVWDCELPYCGNRIGIRSLFEMTMFVGYTKEFYSAVPYKLGSMAVDNSFGKNAKIMRNAKNVVYLFENSKLPKVKSIKRLFYDKPALFFYLEEAEMVWKAIKDINLFCDFIGLNNVYEVLSDIHMSPGIMEYIEDMCNIRNARVLIKNVQLSWRDMLFAAIDYSCANSDVKKTMQEKWKESCDIREIIQRKTLYSVPMKKAEERIIDCSIDGYDFFWLRSSNDYEIAGKKLKNCLVSWSVRNSPVVCVKKAEKYFAAIEISNGMIVQARAYNNSNIEYDRNLSAVFKKWQKKYRIEWEPVSDDEDEGFLPGLD